MSVLIMVLIVKTIIFKLEYKILDFRAGSNPNGLKPKIPKAQMDLARNAQFFGLIKLSPNPVILRAWRVRTAGFGPN